MFRNEFVAVKTGQSSWSMKVYSQVFINLKCLMKSIIKHEYIINYEYQIIHYLCDS